MCADHVPGEQYIAQAIGLGSVAIAGNNSAPISIRVFAVDRWRLEDAFLDPGPLLAKVDHEGFTERRWLIAELDEFIKSVPCGYFVLEAEAGLGKTTFAAWLTRAGGHASHFTGLDSRAREVSFAVRNLSAQLIAAWQLDELLDEGRLPSAADESAWLGRVLTAAARRRDQDHPGNPILLVVDGLDEAIIDHPGGIPLGLPAHLPNGVFVFATQRPGTEVPFTGQVHVRHLRARSPENIADMKAHLARVAAEPSLAARLSAAGMEPQDFCTLLLDRCQGTWIYMHYVLQEIRLGSRQPTDLQTLPADLQSYYSERIIRWRNGPDWREQILPVLATLAATLEPLDANALAALAGRDDPGRVRDLLGDEIRPFCNVSRGITADLFSLYHASLRDFTAKRGDGTALSAVEDLRSELAAATRAAHRRIAERYLSAWGGLDNGLPLLAEDLTLADLDGGYGLRNVVLHLHACGRPLAARGLLTCQADVDNLWYLAFDRAGDIDGYLNSLNQIRKEAEACTDAALDAGGQASDLAFEIRCHLMSASVRSAGSDISPLALKALTAYRVWTPQHALSHLREIQGEQLRSSALGLVAPLLPQELLTQAAKVARGLTDGKERVHALMAIAEHLPAPAGQEIRAEALQVARSLAPGDRAVALSDIIRAAPAEQRNQLIGEALSAARDTQGRLSELPRARSLAAVAAVLDESSLPAVISEIRDLIWDERRSGPELDVLCSVAAYLSPGEIEELVSLAREKFKPLAARRMAALLPHLPEHRRDELIEEVLDSVRTSRDPRPSQFLTLLPFIAETKRKAVIEEANSAARRLREPRDRNTALAWVVPYLTAPERNTALKELRTSTSLIDDAEYRAHFLIKLSENCTGSESTDITARAWDEVRQISEPVMRAVASALIASRLKGSDRRRASNEAIQFLEEGSLGIFGFSVLPEVASLIRPDGKLTRRLLKIARQPTSAINGRNRALAVAEMAQHVSPGWSKLVWFWVDGSFVTALSPEAYRIQVAAQVAQFLPERKRRARMREAIASSMRVADERKRGFCIREISSITRDDDREYLAPLFHGAIATITDRDISLQTLQEFLRDFPPADDAEAVQALERYRGLPVDSTDAERLRRLIPRLPPRLLGTVLDVVRNIERPGDRAAALNDLIPRLTPDQATEALDIVMRLDQDRGEALTTCASRLPDSVLRKIADTGQAATDEIDRLEILTAVYVAAAERVDLITPADRFAPRKDIFAGLQRPQILHLAEAATWWYLRNGDENTAIEITRALCDVARWWP